jgi:phenylalanyl-tRNA synthetase beta chain
MKFTLNWLKEYLDTNASLEQICEKLTLLGLEVENVTDRATMYKGFIVAHVAECEQHPNADRLKQCLVNTGTEQLQVVCGAPNVRKGLKVVFALPGTTIPANGMVLKKTSIRGVDSNGMICSEAELMLSDESNGILELPADAPIGADFAKYRGYNDPVIEINITPNRIDAACVHGIARDLSAAGLGKLKPLARQPVPGSYQSPITVKITDNNACPLFMGRYIRGVKNGPSPKWLQDYLTAIGSRSISALVDITNYICLSLNRPLHVFDADKLNGNITVRLGNDGEKFTDLKGNERTLDAQVIVVADNKAAQAMAGVIGGLESGCTDNTVNVFLESALFNPSMIRRTGKHFAIDSDAKYRFERGIDPTSCDEGIEIATRMILDLCGGEPSYTTMAGSQPEWTRSYAFDPKMTERLGGLNVPASEQLDILMRLGFDAQQRKDGNLDVTPPSWRNDVTGAADLVEEVLRLKSYDAIPAQSVRSMHSVTDTALTGEQKRLSDLRRLCAVRGMNEAVTWSFHGQEAFNRFSYNDRKMVKLANAISADLSVMRHSLLPNLLDAANRNADRKLGYVSLFESGSVFFGTGPDQQPVMLSGIRSNDMNGKTWQSATSQADFFSIKEDVWALLQTAGLNPDNMPLTREAPNWYHPGQSAALRLGKNMLAVFGVMHPGILNAMGIEFPVAAFEIFTENLPPLKSGKSATRATLTLNPLQPLNRDFAFIVSNDIPADAILKAARNVDKNLITDVRLFDVYSGKGMEQGHRSLAFSVTLQPVNATLTDVQIEEVSQKIIAAVQKSGGKLRS